MRPFASQAITGITVSSEAGKPGSSRPSRVAAARTMPRCSAAASKRANEFIGGAAARLRLSTFAP